MDPYVSCTSSRGDFFLVDHINDLDDYALRQASMHTASPGAFRRLCGFFCAPWNLFVRLFRRLLNNRV